MKKPFLLALFSVTLGLVALAQSATAPAKSSPSLQNTLLWRISGNGLDKPSYLFGTMHMLCGDDLVLSDSLRSAIQRADDVYLELDMDNLFELLGAMQHLKMRGDTTLADLLTAAEYKKVKEHFSELGTPLPFSLLESFKPMLAASLLGEQQMKGTCGKPVVMEQLVMTEAKEAGRKVKGLETIKYQLGIFDKIPYRLQAKQLYQMVAGSADTTGGDDIAKLTALYRSQNLDRLEQVALQQDETVRRYADILLFNRNEHWVQKLKELMPTRSLVVAVGAGHLPGKRGVIQLLRAAGYSVEPVKNEMTKAKTRAI